MRRVQTIQGLMAAVVLVAIALGLHQLGRRQATPVLVWVTRSGTRYHRAGCRYTRTGSVRCPLAEARTRYRACAVCKPPL